MFGRGLRSLSIASLVLVTGAFALVFFYAPNEADQGFVQKIFYLHVPMAIVALGGFVAGGVYAVRYLQTGDRAHDLRSYVAIHLSLIFGLGVLATGSIWAKASWGAWWVWDEPTLVSFLIVFLLFACYQPLRFSIDDPERQARYAAVFAIIGGAFVPLNFLAVRLAESLIHPRVLSTTGGSMPGEMRLTFLISFVAMVCLFVTLWKYELASKHASMRLRALQALAGRRRGGGPARAHGRPDPALMTPALPLDDAGPYVAGAYLVFLALILVYVAIMATKLARIERELVELSELAEKRARGVRRGRGARGGAADERADRARRVAQDRRRRGARADRADRGGGGALHARARGRADDLRGRRALDLQPHRALPRGRRRRSRRRAPCSATSRGAPACGRPSSSRASTRCATATRRGTSIASPPGSSRW